MGSTPTRATKMSIKIISSMGRRHLLVNGFVVATEGAICRDQDLVDKFQYGQWTFEMMQYVQKNTWWRMIGGYGVVVARRIVNPLG